MSISRSNIRRVRYAVENTFGTDQTGSIANFWTLRVTSVETPGAAQEFLDDARLRSYRQQSPAMQLGFKNGALTIGGQLVSTGVELNKDATWVAYDSTTFLLSEIIGGHRADVGSLVASGASETGCVVTAGQGSRFPEGVLVGVETGVGTGLFEATCVRTRSTDTLTFAHALSFTPAVGAKVINSDLFYEANQPSSTFQFLVEGEDRDNIFLYLGCQGNLSIEWPLGGEIKWTSQQQFASWAHDDELATPQGGSALSVYSLDGSSPVIARSGSIIFATRSSTTRTLPNVASLTFDPAISWTPVTSFNGVQGRAAYERTSSQPMATIQVPYADETYKDAMAAGTKYRLLAQAGTVGGSILALELPTVQIVAVKPVSVNGLDYEELTLRCLPDEGASDTTNDRIRASWRLGRL